MESSGLLHLYYGDGKGKTTAAMGLALRALGSGKRVVIVQFLKGGQSGEIPLLEQLGATVYRGKAGQKFVFQMNEAEKAATRALQNQNLAAALAQPCDLLVLDEAGSAWELDMVDKALLQKAVRERPAARECVLTAHQPPQWMLDEADYVVMESTYGDRSHGPRPDYIRELASILQETFDRGGNVVIPSFAVGRTQEMLYFLREINEKGLVKGHGNFPVYIDSPLATEATRIFRDTDPDCFDAQTRALLEKGIDPINVPGLRISVTSDDSRMINTDRTPKVILSASGMCEAGRIRHHLKHNLWRPECTILFVGYQAVGTLGRTLIEGATTVKLFGEPIEVQAEICQLTGMSGHADRDGLLRWVNAFTEKPKRVFVMHGEDEVENIFVDTLTGQGFTACAPYNGAQWAIGAEGAVCLQEGTKVRVEQRTGEGANRAATVFQRLVSAGKRLLRVIEHNEGGANKDLAKFADQINALCDKWDH